MAAAPAGHDDAALPCSWKHKLTPAATSPLGKAIKPAVLVLACKRNCGKFAEPLSGKCLDRAGKVVDEVCLNPPPRAAEPDAKRHQPAASSATAASLGLLPAQMAALPWQLSPGKWREYLEIIVAPSSIDRRAAVVAVKALKDEQKPGQRGIDAAGAADKPDMAIDSSARFRELLRYTSPFDSSDVLPLASAIASYLTAVDHNHDLPAADQLTVPAAKIRRGEAGPPLRIESVMAIHTLKLLLDQGRTWFRTIVDKLSAARSTDPVHYVKLTPGEVVSKTTKLMVWPIRWAVVLLKSWQAHLTSLPMDSPTPALMACLTTDAELPLLSDPEEFDMCPLLVQAGALTSAIASDPTAPGPAASLKVLNRHVKHNAARFYSTVIAVKAMQDDYKKAIGLGASLGGVAARQTKKQPKSGQGHGQQGQGAGRHASAAAGAGASGQGALSDGFPSFTPRNRFAATGNPPPSLPPFPAAGSGVVPFAPRPSAGAAGAAAGGAGSAGGTGSRPGPRPTFARCMGIGCARAPPNGAVSFAPFGKCCGATHDYDWATGVAKRK